MRQTNTIQIMRETIVEIAQVLFNDLLADETIFVGQEFQQEVLMLKHSGKFV